MPNNNDTAKSRRWFLSIFSPAEKPVVKKEMVKMLTPDGKLVEVEKEVLDAISKKQKASNKEIYDWMKNPSKDNNS
jgi:hypothetical protein